MPSSVARLAIYLFSGIVTVMGNAYGSGEAFAKTSPGRVEIKTLPAGRLLESRSDGEYFESSNELFRPLFRYISQRGISMTTPVEARMQPGAMYFWVDANQEEAASEDTESVRVIDVPERNVAAVGFKGTYSERNFDAAKSILMDWLEARPSIAAAGEPYAVFWNGPFTPWFMKTFEVHVEIRESPSGLTRLAPEKTGSE